MFFQEQICVKENEEFFGIFLYKKIQNGISKIIDYSIETC
jgi:hypothetical protein